MPRGRKRKVTFVPQPWIHNSSSEDEHRNDPAPPPPQALRYEHQLPRHDPVLPEVGDRYEHQLPRHDPVLPEVDDRYEHQLPRHDHDPPLPGDQNEPIQGKEVFLTFLLKYQYQYH